MKKITRYPPENVQQQSHDPEEGNTFGITCFLILMFALGMGFFSALLVIFKKTTRRSKSGDVLVKSGPNRGFWTPSYTPPKQISLDEYHHLCSGKKCNVAVVACASSRGVWHDDFDSMALIQLMMPSLLRTVETERFSYAIYIGIDEDDFFWNNPNIKKKLKSFVRSSVSGKSMGGRVVSFPQPNIGPKRIPMNEIINVAYQDGADYIVRINDDTEFITNEWTSVGVGTLLAMDPPNVGVVGPTCFDGNEEILTHDMVHRTHVEIFDGKYYPPVFKNWYLDDWITHVYGEKRTQKIPASYWEVKHHMYHHGTRYAATGDRWMVDDELMKTRRNIDDWLNNHTTPTQILVTPGRLFGFGALCYGIFLAWRSRPRDAAALVRGKWEDLGDMAGRSPSANRISQSRND